MRPSYLWFVLLWFHTMSTTVFCLSGRQRRSLRAIAARMKNTKTHISIPFDVLSTGSISNIKDTISKHEMVSVRFNSIDKKSKAKYLAAAVAEACQCEVAQTVGHSALLYKEASPPKEVTILLNEMMNEIKSANSIPTIR